MESEEIVSPILAILAIGVVFAAAIAMFVVELPSGERVRAAVYRHTQKAIFAIAATAMVSSLYYSDYVHFTPCELCWYQRIAMYPIAVLLLVTLATRSRLAPRYILAMAGIGLVISIYHYQLELFPDQAQICTGAAVSCTVRFVEEFGFVSIPFMAGSGFLAILILQVAEWRADRWYGDGEPA
jgi:disulfide bond formation protein DsbB